MKKFKRVNLQRQRRKFRVRRNLTGNAERPRLSVFRSNKHIYCQMVDDAAGKTLCSASTRDKTLVGEVKFGGNSEAAKLIGKAIAERAAQVGITQVTFDRGKYKYHGRVAELADAAREAGLKF